MKAAIVIVNYNCQALTSICLAGVKAHLVRDGVEVIVVDNSPDDELSQIIAGYPEVVGLRPGRNLGFAGGCNLGIRQALEDGVDYIQLLNPDTEVNEDFLSPMIEAMQREPTLAIAGPKVLYEDGRVWYGGSRMNWWLGGPVQIFDSSLDSAAPLRLVPMVSGCAMLLRSEAVRLVGEMDEGYFLYYEDADYCMAMAKAGLKIAYLPGPKLTHAASAAAGFQSVNYIYYFSRNRIRFMKRWARWYHFVVYMTYNTLVKLPGSIIIFGLLRREPQLVSAYFKGYWDGLIGRVGKRGS